jgi:ABC-type nickel/cobalt efflux system permease component RcnA
LKKEKVEEVYDASKPDLALGQYACVMALVARLNGYAHKQPTYTLTHTHTHIHTHTHTHTHIHTCTHTYMYAHIYSRTHTNTHTHTQARTRRLPDRRSLRKRG